MVCKQMFQRMEKKAINIIPLIVHVAMVSAQQATLLSTV